MSGRAALVTAAIVALAWWAWSSELFVVARPGEVARPLAVRDPAQRAPAAVDVVLPAVPAGMLHLRHGAGSLLVHYWAPWERHGATQAAGLDSLRRLPEMERLQIVVVCFDPYPSVARYVARQRLRLPVLLDGGRLLRRALPCPSVPFTYVLDASGRIAVAQAGEIDWLAPETRAALEKLAAEGASPSPPPPS